MPIRVTYHDKESELTLPTIYPDEPTLVNGLFIDRNKYQPHYVIVKCNHDDSGGFVMRAALEDYGLFAPDLSMSEGQSTQLEVVIGPQGSYPRSITSIRGTGRLLLEHF